MEIEIIAIRLLLTFVLALLFGIERERSHEPIGFGTFIFVAMGSCALSIASLSISPSDPTKLLGGIVTGVGFLGAGALIKKSDKISGFTTAAGIWIFAILGLLIGMGEYIIVFICYPLIWIILVIKKILSVKNANYYRHKIVINTDRPMPKERIRSLFPKFEDLKWVSTNVNKKDKSAQYAYLTRCHKNKLDSAIVNMEKTDWVLSYEIE